MAGETYSRAFEAVRARLSDASAAHSERVAATAGGLALAYGVDPESARLAGVLHDWDREQSAGALISAARSAGIESPPPTRPRRTCCTPERRLVALERALPGGAGGPLGEFRATRSGRLT